MASAGRPIREKTLNSNLDDRLWCYYNDDMEYEWDDKKNAANRVKHGIDFNIAEGFCWDTAVETIDDSADYGEERWVALGLIEDRVHVMVYTLRDHNIRIISLRKANNREAKYYARN